MPDSAFYGPLANIALGGTWITGLGHGPRDLAPTDSESDVYRDSELPVHSTIHAKNAKSVVSRRVEPTASCIKSVRSSIYWTKTVLY